MRAHARTHGCVECVPPHGVLCAQAENYSVVPAPATLDVLVPSLRPDGVDLLTVRELRLARARPDIP